MPLQQITLLKFIHTLTLTYASGRTICLLVFLFDLSFFVKSYLTSQIG
jgi:hypothetical protein